MPEAAYIVLAVVCVLMMKHTTADFFLQTPYQYCDKGMASTAIPTDCCMRESTSL
jgi:hypothetical protein